MRGLALWTIRLAPIRHAIGRIDAFATGCKRSAEGSWKTRRGAYMLSGGDQYKVYAAPKLG
ncbi:MAG: hypothetical protein BGN87_18320 [Rhizobiales bacterium 65-79]|nr:MAG: hypothetical protein BGN87_18320 [Rhizobiales bacterium 65-79]